MALPVVTAWSYSRWSDYDKCPLFFKLKHLDKLPTQGSPAMDRGNVIHKLSEDFALGKIKKLPTELKNYAEKFAHLKALKPMVEQQWGFKSDWTHTGRQGWFGDDVWFRAKADAFAVYEDNTGDLIDHKTGKKYETNKDQVELFALAGFMRLPQLTHITARLWYLDLPEKEEVVLEFPRSEVPRIQKEWNGRVRPMFNDRKFPPKPNDKCHWCDFSVRKGGPCKF